MTEVAKTRTSFTVGQLADLVGVTVRTLHHYHEVGLLTPSNRTPSGYRLYSPGDVTRLQLIVVYRRLELPLDEIAVLLKDNTNLAEHLRRQRASVVNRLSEMNRLVSAIDSALEAAMNNNEQEPHAYKDVFGDTFDDWRNEAATTWGDTEAFRQSNERTASFSHEDWESVKNNGEVINAAFIDALRAGADPSSDQAMAAAEQHRIGIEQFFTCNYEMHQELAETYLSDERFFAYYETRAAGLAQYVRDAIFANAERNGA